MGTQMPKQDLSYDSVTLEKRRRRRRKYVRDRFLRAMRAGGRERAKASTVLTNLYLSIVIFKFFSF